MKRKWKFLRWTTLSRKNDELRKRVAEMTAEAANNETIMKRTQARELTLLRADTLSQLLLPWSTDCAIPTPLMQ